MKTYRKFRQSRSLKTVNCKLTMMTQLNILITAETLLILHFATEFNRTSQIVTQKAEKCLGCNLR